VVSADAGSGGAANGADAEAGTLVAADAGAPADSGAAVDLNRRHLLLRDEAKSTVSYVELGNAAAGWHVVTPYGRDLQLVGSGHFMIGTDNGYEERSLADGSLIVAHANFPGTQAAHRLRNGHTILCSVTASGILLLEVNAAAAVQAQVTYPGFTYVRLIRQTPAGTFLVTADDVVFEGDATGKILWRVNVGGPGDHVWEALRIPTGETVVSTGYLASIQIFGADGTLHRTITGPANVIPNQFVGFQILPNGDFVVANWLGHTGEVAGVQLLEYDPTGTLVWSYRPNPMTESLSLHHVIVLDGLDVSKLNVDDTTGMLVPVL
jgi:hypothetical protein